MSTPRVIASGVLGTGAAGTLFAWSIVADDLRREFQVRPTSTAAVFGTALACFTLTLLLLGHVTDRSSPRAILVMAAMLSGTGFGLGAIAPNFVTVGIGVGVVFSLGSGMAYLVATGLAARLPSGSRTHVIGLVVAGYAAGPVLLGIIGPPLVDAAGWRVCLGWLAVVVTGLMLLAAWLAPRQWSSPVSRPDGTAAVRGAAAPSLLWITFAFGSAPALVAFAQAVDIGASTGLSHRAAGGALSVLSAGNVAGRLLAGTLASARGPRPGLAGALALELVALVGLLVGGGVWTTLAAFSAMGLAYGAISALVPAATAEITDPSEFGRTYGRVFSGWGVAGLIAPLLAAHLASTAGYHQVLQLSVVAVVAAAVSLSFLSRVARRQPAGGL